MLSFTFCYNQRNWRLKFHYTTTNTSCFPVRNQSTMPRRDRNLGFPMTTELWDWKGPSPFGYSLAHLETDYEITTSNLLWMFPRTEVLQSGQHVWEKVITLNVKNSPSYSNGPLVSKMFADLSVISPFAGITYIFLTLSLEYLVSLLWFLLFWRL